MQKGYFFRRVLGRACDDARGRDYLARKLATKERRIFTAEVDAFLQEQALKWEGDFSLPDMGHVTWPLLKYWVK